MRPGASRARAIACGPTPASSSESLGIRALAGLDVTIDDRFFLVFALGVSQRIEKGEDTGVHAKRFIETPLELDGYFLIGVVFDRTACR